MRRERSGGWICTGDFGLRQLSQFCLSVAAVLSAAEFAVGDEFPAAALQGIVQQHCQSCHDGATRAGGLSLDSFATDLQDDSVFQLWQHVYDRVLSDQMPPSEARQSWQVAD
ncbi:MAG: c-type cytochrome domain-containing protein, partial [Planctomycetaceae bacterium]